MKSIALIFMTTLAASCTQVVTYKQPAIVPSPTEAASTVEPLGVVSMVGIRPEDPQNMMVEFY